MVIEKVAREYELFSIAQKHFGQCAGLFMDLVAYLIIEEGNQGQHYPDYAYRHPLFTDGMRILSDSTISNFLASITDDQITGFLDDWNENRDHGCRIYISYDSTNKNCQSGDIELLEFGKAKDAKNLPIFNVSLAYDKTNQVPLFYELYPGSINDVSQFIYLVDKALAYNYRNIGFILDRGYFSKENIQYMDVNDYQFIMMVKGCKPLVSGIVDQLRGSFEHRRQFALKGHSLSGCTVQRKLYEDDAKDRFFHVFFSPAKMAAERQKLNLKIDQMQQQIDKCVGKVCQFGKPYTTYFDFNYDKNKQLLFAAEKADVIEQEALRCGYFCIVTSEKMTAAQAYSLYRGRDISEKLFSADKSFIGSKSMCVHTQQAVQAKILIEFVALIIRNRIYNLLKDENLKQASKKNFMTVPVAIRELEKIELVRINHGSYQLDHAITRNQTIVLNAFGMRAEDIRKKSSEIAADLAEADAKASASTDEEEYEEEDEDYAEA